MAKYREEISRETFEQIENYLLDRMDDETRLQFEASMAGDEELAAEVELQQKLFATVEAGSFSIHEQKGLPVNTSRMYTFWYAAAAVLLLCGVASFWFFGKGTGSKPENLYAEYYQPDPGLPVEMGTADSANYLFYDGMISYKEGDYEQALAKWAKVVPTNSKSDTLQYYIAMAQLNNGNIKESINVLTKLNTNSGAPYYEEVNWYLALVYVKTGDKNKALYFLNNIRQYPGALSLLKKLQQE